jgi:GDP-D-mannose dehydratase
MYKNLNKILYFNKMSFDLCTKCRICQNPELVDIVDLGEQVITSRFPVYGDFSTPKTPIVLSLCKECSLVQLKHGANCSELYEHEYGYRSGINYTMREHLRGYQEEIKTKVELNPGDVIIDIGSNDSTMLQYYDQSLKRIGVDPTGVQFQHFYGDVELVPNYFTRDNVVSVYGENIRCKVVSSISMFYDLPDPVQFAKDIHSFLADDGIWTCEQSYLLTMLETNSIDTICHEHLEYYSLTAVKRIADMAGFKIIDIKFNQCNGGSFRLYFAKQTSDRVESELVSQILEKEQILGVKEQQFYTNFINDCDAEVDRLTRFIDIVNSDNKKMYIYGASTKGNCLLQYANIDSQHIKYAVERNPNKVGKMTSTGIEIISEETMRESPPEFLLVLPWHFRDEIIHREHEYLSNGGQLVFPFPKFEIYSLKPKLLLTGCDGMISGYLIEEATKTYSLYGVGHTQNRSSSQMLRTAFDVVDSSKLEKLVMTIRPDKIVHLAGISSSQYAYENPLETLYTNGLVAAHLCDIIYKNKLSNCCMFNASSSEIYKGHVKYTVRENDDNMHHLHPYSIAKTMGHKMVDFYRTTHGLKVSNGIIFTTESPNKSNAFLLNKVAEHSMLWKETRQPLLLGSLDSKRNIIHARDVATSILCIIDQAVGDNYLICNTENANIYDLVVRLYDKQCIKVTKKDNTLYETSTGDVVVLMEDSKNGLDKVCVDINGTPEKLMAIGWKPNFTIDQILDNISMV